MNKTLQALQEAKKNYNYINIRFDQPSPLHLYTLTDIETARLQFTTQPETGGTILGCSYNNADNYLFVDFSPYTHCDHEVYSDAETFNFVNRDTGDSIFLHFKKEIEFYKTVKAN